MALNIKSEEAHRLARELAEATGTTLTDAVTSALHRTLSQETKPAGVEVLLAEVAEIQQFVADLPDRDDRRADDLLGYDEQGLPG